jgi:large subunit ribosomal protein L33
LAQSSFRKTFLDKPFYSTLFIETCPSFPLLMFKLASELMSLPLHHHHLPRNIAQTTSAPLLAYRNASTQHRHPKKYHSSTTSTHQQWPRKVYSPSSSQIPIHPEYRVTNTKTAKSRTIAVRLISMALTGYYKTLVRPRQHRPLSMLKYDPVGMFSVSYFLRLCG